MENILNSSDVVLQKRINDLKTELRRRREIRRKRKDEKYFLKQSLDTRYRRFINQKYMKEREENFLEGDKKDWGLLSDFIYRWEKATGYCKKPSEEIKKEKLNWILFLLDMYPSEYTCHEIEGVTYYLFYFRTPAGQLSFHMPLDCEGIVSMKAKSKENPNAIWWGVKGHCLIVANRLDQDKKFEKKARAFFKNIEKGDKQYE